MSNGNGIGDALHERGGEIVESRGTGGGEGDEESSAPRAARGHNGNGHRQIDRIVAEAMRDGFATPAARASDGNGEARTHYDCAKCPAYCCSYEKINVHKRDIARLARHFGIDVDTAQERFTKIVEGERVLRHQKDDVYGSVCVFLDTEERRCTVYQSRPRVCHEYPDRARCGYYDFLRWERRHQDDREFVPLRKG